MSLKKRNKYIIKDDYVIGFTNNTNKEFYFDLEDYDKVSQCSWSENDNGYIITYTINRKKAIRLHRYVMNLEMCSYPIIDHKNNKCGIKGVSLDKRNNKYSARIMVNGKNIFLGYFEDKEKAKESRNKAEQKYFGEFAYKGETI